MSRMVRAEAPPGAGEGPISHPGGSLASRRVDPRWDVLVIGAGHAGVEAAWAVARLGCRVALCTLSDDTVAHMPCNPAIGGTAKGHLVREIDALGGLMALATDATAIQFKLLNRSRGPAVWSPRAQCDKRRYGAWVRDTLRELPGLDWLLGKVEFLIVENGRAVGVRLESGVSARAHAIVVTTGTFLNGLIHIGEETWRAGRLGEGGFLRARGIAQGAAAAMGPAQDGNAAAPGQAEHRLRPRRRRRGVQAGARRRRPRTFFLHDERRRRQPDCLSSGSHDGARPRPGAPECRAVAALQRADTQESARATARHSRTR